MCKVKKYKGSSNVRIDSCMEGIIFYLKWNKIKTLACCCGHGKYPMTIVVKHGYRIKEIFSLKEIPRTRNFYKRDKQGYYYIPETLKE